ncbi:terminase large subunit [Acinetobacter pittii]|uniref:terminase large subunit n=1 Tax=Acinetobacter pittii TaxID=48296 RepID=UPI001023AAC0|nr:terminase TerL endonuclease subunit [Acinetobacter pittii]RZH03144.1 terminase large subunit [Acinetobacter pittii]
MRDYFKIALQYCHDVRSGVRTAGQLEKFAVKRFLNDLNRSGIPLGSGDEELEKLLTSLKIGSKPPDINFEFRFDVERAQHACFFIETCPHVEGELARLKRDGTRHLLVMSPWQVFVTVNIFGWVDYEGLRRFTYVYLEVAKKNGKTTWLAAVGLYMGFIDGEPGSNVYAAATTRDQANILFGAAKTMVAYSPKMQERFGITKQEYSIFQTTTNSSFKALSQDRDGSKDGFNVHCGLIDELHAHKDSGMYDIVSNGIASRAQPLLFAITTAGKDTTSVCYRERKIVVAILKGEATHERYFGMIFCLDKGDDWKDPKNWPKANPNYGISVKPEYLQGMADKCKISPSNEAIFRQKHLNEWVGAVDGWLAESVVSNCEVEVSYKEFKGVVGFGGYDLASRLDLASWDEMRPRFEDGKIIWYVFAHSYINERVMESTEAINGEMRPDDYPVWRDDGWLIETPGASTDFNRIKEDILAHHLDYPFYEVGHDPYHAEQVTADLLDAGLNVIEVPQRTEFLSPAMRWIEVLIAENRIRFCGDPVLKWCILNVVVKEDAKENIFPRKISRAKKIDAAVGMIIAASRAMYWDKEEVFELVPGEENGNFDDFLSGMIKVSRR